MNLYKYEFKKIFKSKLFVFLFILLAILNLSFGIFMGENKVREDDYSERYSKEIENIIYNAKMNYISIDDKESENAQYQLEIIKKYTAIQYVDVSGESQGYDDAIASPIASVSGLLVGFIAAIMITYKEHSSNLILSSFQQSRVRICLTKILLLFAIAFVGVFVFFGFNTIGSAVSNGFRFFGSNLPVQCIENYIHCPYQISILQALLLRLLFTSLIVFTVSMIVFLFGIFSRKAVWTLLFAVLFISGDFLLADISSKKVFSFFHNINIKSFITDSWLLRYSGKKILRFLSQIEIFSLVVVILLAVLFLLTILFFRYSKVIQSVKSKNHRVVGKKCSTKSLLYYEGKKIYSGKVIIALALLLVANIFILNASVRTENRDAEKIYIYYIKQMSDLTYEEQIEFSTSSKVNLNKLITEAQSIRNKFINGEETHEKYTESQQRAGAAELEIAVLQIIDQQLTSIGTLNEQGIQAKLLYSTGWKKLMVDSSNLFLLFAIIMLIVPYISYERESGISTILSGIFWGSKSTYRKFNLMKFLVAFSSSLIIAFIFNFAELLLIASRYELNNWTSYAAGADILFHNIHLKLIGALLLRLVFSIFGIIIIILITDVLITLIKKSIFVILIMIAIELPLYVISAITNKTVLSIVSYFSFEMLYMSPIIVIVQTTFIIFILTMKIWFL